MPPGPIVWVGKSKNGVIRNLKLRKTQERRKACGLRERVRGFPWVVRFAAAGCRSGCRSVRSPGGLERGLEGLGGTVELRGAGEPEHAAQEHVDCTGEWEWGVGHGGSTDR